MWPNRGKILVVIDPERAQKDRERRAWRRQIDDLLNSHAEKGTEAKQDKHRVRELAYGRTSTGFDWELALAIYGHKCAFCGDTERLTVDHIIPLSRGGGNWQFNIRPLCEWCNCSKGSQLDAECWIGRQEGTTSWAND